MPHKSQRRTPHHKSAPRPIAPRPTAPRPTEFTSIPSTASSALLTRNGPTNSYNPLPTALTHKMDTLITLSHRLESILHGLNYGLFTTPAEHRNAHARLKHLRTAYSSLCPQVDRELAALGYLPATGTPNIFPAPTTKPPPPPLFPKLITTTRTHVSHKHKYGPTSPQYTVDKALKRKADSQGGAASAHVHVQPPVKKQRVDGGAESDFVETECESVDEGSRKVQVEWPPAPITNLAAEKPLGEVERRRMMGWSWGGAARTRTGGRAVVGEWMWSPLGTGVVW
ncbi:hypothetical protein PMIN04_009091 [Paraphaeosphaeria minitans]|uniref:Uncharacterized protein n=1 Tax=Paraphaeosphaeria minitans TaxID=565426 RepID=A0A9P6KKC9_9PLEO|nr:hypothetical protein PMIN01_12340 [Paraphaeosphaeria minitans]